MLSNFLAPAITVTLPYNFNVKNLHVVLEGALDDSMMARSSKIKFDFATLKFIDPTAITVLSNLIEYLKHRQNARVFFTNYNFPTEGNKYLDDSGFFQLYVGKQVFEGCKLRPTTLPLTKVSYDRSYNWIEDTFPNWISTRSGLDTESFASIVVCLKEIFNNIRDHSGETIGCVFAQHYPQKNEVMLTISDFGVGIPTNVRKLLPDFTDAQAIAKSVVEGFTTRSTNRNRGAGLDTLTRYVVGNNRGRVFVQSLKGSLNCIYAASGVRMLPRSELVAYPGTLIQIVFRIDMLDQLGRKEEFEW